MPLAVFRADATPAIGGGHLVRCLALADALVSQGWRCVVVSDSRSESVVPDFGSAPVERFNIPTKRADDSATLRALCPAGTDLVVVDHYGCSSEFERACRSNGRRLMAIDDMPHRTHACDLLLDQTLDRAVGEYQRWVEPGCEMLLGPRYALLRPSFARLRPASLARRARYAPPRKLLITVGAGANQALLGIIVAGLGHCIARFEEIVVVGAADSELAGIGPTSRLSIRSLRYTSHIDQLMVEADLAITNAGATSWERCCLGLPALTVCLSDNQRDIDLALERAGASRSLGEAAHLTSAAVANGIDSLFGDLPSLVAMSRHAARICDGLGATRVAARLTELAG